MTWEWALKVHDGKQININLIVITFAFQELNEEGALIDLS